MRALCPVSVGGGGGGHGHETSQKVVCSQIGPHCVRSYGRGSENSFFRSAAAASAAHDRSEKGGRIVGSASSSSFAFPSKGLYPGSKTRLQNKPTREPVDDDDHLQPRHKTKRFHKRPRRRRSAHKRRQDAVFVASRDPHNTPRTAARRGLIPDKTAMVRAASGGGRTRGQPAAAVSRRRVRSIPPAPHDRSNPPKNRFTGGPGGTLHAAGHPEPHAEAPGAWS